MTGLPQLWVEGDDIAKVRQPYQARHRSLLRNGRGLPPGAWLGLIVAVDLVLALVVRIPSLLGIEPLEDAARWQWVLDAVLLSFVPI